MFEVKGYNCDRDIIYAKIDRKCSDSVEEEFGTQTLNRNW